MVRPSRRTFLKGIGIAGAAGLIGSNAMAATPADEGTGWPVSRGTDARTGYTQGSGPGPYAAPSWSPGNDLSGDPTEVTVADGTAYIGTVVYYDYGDSSGEVAAYDATGEGVRWIRNDDSIGAVDGPVTVADGRVLVSTSPAVAYTAGDSQDETPPNGGLMALDAETGDTLWVNKDVGTNDAALVRDGTVYLGPVAVDLETGDEQWRVAIDDDVAVESQALGADSIYVATSETVAEISLDGTVQWKADPPDGINATSLATDGDHLYLTEDSYPRSDTVWALSPDDGSVVWETQVAADFADSEPNHLSAPAVADGTVYVASEDSTAPPDNDYQNDDDERVGALHALSAETGEEQWQFTTAAQLMSTPAVTDNTVYVGGTYPTEDAVKYERDAGYFEHGSTYVGTVYARPAIYALNRADGSEQWSYGIDETASDTYVNTTTVADGHLYVQVMEPELPPYGYIGGVYVLESSESEPGPTHTLVDDTPYKEEEPVRAVITSDPENAEELDFDSGATVTLSGGDSSSPTGEIVSYEWDIDADGEFEKSGESIEVELDYCGILEMTLRVTDDSDRTQTTSISLSTV
ncbi:PQQ-binding-like beta-propeller repeat protein [Haladaptatus sp. QDMS2]|uniref:outer membrane protein assembly factor BamB family protein n=1 Tax=Haladaptatus sp. QDMS2 TaxID=3033391 RepID=UPI0023E858BE|nr:PQQ-binding-like beta-propeller repeat protein [Haladaptatus sp. QDMS2]